MEQELNKARLTAKEATELADKAVMAAVISKTDEIFANIKATALSGDFFVTVGIYSGDIIFNHKLLDPKPFTDLGFKVEYKMVQNKYRTEYSLTEILEISWGE